MDLDLDLDLTISESEDLDLEKEDLDLDLPLCDLTTSRLLSTLKMFETGRTCSGLCCFDKRCRQLVCIYILHVLTLECASASFDNSAMIGNDQDVSYYITRYITLHFTHFRLTDVIHFSTLTSLFLIRTVGTVEDGVIGAGHGRTWSVRPC